MDFLNHSTDPMIHDDSDDGELEESKCDYFFIVFPFLGALIYLLDLFCNATNPNVREQTADLLAKILADKLVGPKVRILMTKFLPTIFMDAMRDNPQAAVHMFEGE